MITIHLVRDLKVSATFIDNQSNNNLKVLLVLAIMLPEIKLGDQQTH